MQSGPAARPKPSTWTCLCQSDLRASGSEQWAFRADVDCDGRLEHAAALHAGVDLDALLEAHGSELEAVLAGEETTATLQHGALTASVEAMIDGAGARHALLTVRGGDARPVSDDASPLLTEDLDASPAVIFLRDLDGKYLRVNAAHAKLTGGESGQLVGRSDSEVHPRLTVDGPRLAERGKDTPAEPLQLEYMVPAFEQRPALCVLRFIIHDATGRPSAVCGVAAPLADAELARAEAERLVTLERIARMGAAEARTQLLHEWGLAAPDAAGVLPELPGSGTETLLDAEELDDARLRIEQARVEAEQAQARSEHLERELLAAVAALDQVREAARREQEDADLARSAGQAARGEASQALIRIEALQAEAAQLASRLDQAEMHERESRSAAEQAAAESVQARARAEAAEEEVSRARARVDELDAEARTATRRAEEAVAARRVVEARVAESDADARQARERAAESETEARQAKARAEQAELEARKATAGLERAELEVRQAQGAAEAAASELRVARARIEELEESARQARVEIEGLESAARQSRTQIETLAASERQAQARVQELADAVRQAQARVEQVTESERAAQARAEQLEAAARQAKLETEELRGALERASAATSQAEAAVREWRARAQEAQDALPTRGTTEKAPAPAEDAQARRAFEADLQSAGAQTAELRESLAGERARTEELRESLAGERARTEELRSSLTEARERLTAASAELEAENTRRGVELERSDDALARAREDAAREVGAAREALQAAQAALVTERERTAERLREAQEAAATRLAAAESAAAVAVREAQLGTAVAVQAEEAGAAAVREAEAARVAAQHEVELAREARLLAESELAALHAEVEASHRSRVARAAETDAANASGSSDSRLRWPPRAARELLLSLSDVEDVRSGLRAAASVLGRSGGWDLVVAWSPDPGGMLRCVASWSSEQLRELEQLTIRSPQPLDGSSLGAALYARNPVVMEAPEASAIEDEPRGAAAIKAGVRTTLLLPIREGVARIGLLELVSTAVEEPSRDLVESLEVVGLQLGQFAALMRSRHGRR